MYTDETISFCRGGCHELHRALIINPVWRLAVHERDKPVNRINIIISVSELCTASTSLCFKRACGYAESLWVSRDYQNVAFPLSFFFLFLSLRNALALCDAHSIKLFFWRLMLIFLSYFVIRLRTFEKSLHDISLCKCLSAMCMRSAEVNIALYLTNIIEYQFVIERKPIANRAMTSNCRISWKFYFYFFKLFLPQWSF